jgi:transcriptional regulator with XRE-family HTH domain
MIDIIKVGMKIETLRSSANLTQSELASKLFVSHQAVSKWERGLNLPSIETMVMITDLFKVSIDDLIYDVEVSNENFAELMRTHSREFIIKEATINSDLDLSDIIFLLSKEERMQVLYYLENGPEAKLIDLWPYLSKIERSYVMSEFDLEIARSNNLNKTPAEYQILKRRREDEND